VEGIGIGEAGSFLRGNGGLVATHGLPG
jgi:hypothetical protein